MLILVGDFRWALTGDLLLWQVPFCGLALDGDIKSCFVGDFLLVLLIEIATTESILEKRFPSVKSL